MLAEAGADIPEDLREEYGPIQHRARQWKRVAVITSSMKALGSHYFREHIRDLIPGILEKIQHSPKK